MTTTELCDTIPEEGNETSTEELKVHFEPQLYLQRRMWILDILRRENIIDVLDIGCGEGELLQALCQPAPWLAPPSDVATENIPPDTIRNLHPIRLAGLDLFVSEADLSFAIEAVTPPPDLNVPANQSDGIQRRYSHLPKRWEELQATVWKGGLEVVNEEFIGNECIVSSEVIEHLPPEIFPYFAPMVLGVYHPQFLLVTTPSYTFNARFTAPKAPKSARKGFPDPTGRTDRVFRHHDHKFEWTVEEFRTWCTEIAQEWGYQVSMSDIGRAADADPWGREKELGGASLVAEFRRKADRDQLATERRARELIRKYDQDLGVKRPEHQAVAQFVHQAHSQSKQPTTLRSIGDQVKCTLEQYGDFSQTISEMWYDEEIPVLCGGWLEYLIQAVEDHPDLILKREELSRFTKGREYWNVELVGAATANLWPNKREESVDESFIPVEDPYEDSSTSGREDSQDDEADISWNEAEEGLDDGWGKSTVPAAGWGWAQEEVKDLDFTIPLHSSTSSTTGWDGDDSDSDRTS